MEPQRLLEDYLPNYYGRKDVARLDDLHKKLSGEMEDEEMVEKGLLNIA